MRRDHTYGNRSSVLTASYEPKDEVGEDYVKLEAAEVEEKGVEAPGPEPRAYRKGLSMIDAADARAPLPALPQESALFFPPTERGQCNDINQRSSSHKVTQIVYGRWPQCKHIIPLLILHLFLAMTKLAYC